LTYISITATISTLEAVGKLTRYVPRGRHLPKRRLYLTVEALNDLTNPNSAVNLLVRRSYVEAALTRWTLGERVYGNRRGGRFLKRLDPPPSEIWEIRVTEPTPQARLLGRFAEPDTLILTKFFTRGLLGDKGSQAWQNAMQECELSWNTLFAGTPPFSGNRIHVYVTENCDDFPI
jgi:hypothetical protein